MWCAVCTVVPPAAHGDAGGREAAGGDRDRLPGREGPGAVVVGDVDAPAAGGGGAGGGDVAAEADEHPAATRGAATARAARSAAHALAVAPRSSTTPLGMRTV